MFYVTNYTFAVCLCVVCMLCWGSWGNTQKLVGKSWRFELFYWDYVIGLLAFALAMGLTLGSCGENANWGFIANLKASFGVTWLWPFAAGIVFNLSNILLSAAIAVAGMCFASPLPENNALDASRALLASSSLCTNFVSSKARISLASLILASFQPAMALISSRGKKVSIRKHFITSASSTLRQY